jgi:hypothetical protein
MNKQIQYGRYIINNLSELLEAKNPKGVLILEGNLSTWKDEGDQEGSLYKTWQEAIDDITCVCDNLSIGYIRTTRKDFHKIVTLDNGVLRKTIKQGITSQVDLGLYIAGCLCCVERGSRDESLSGRRDYPSTPDFENTFLFDVGRLGNLFGLDRVFVASSQEGQNAPQGYIKNFPKDGYFLV